MGDPHLACRAENPLKARPASKLLDKGTTVQSQHWRAAGMYGIAGRALVKRGGTVGPAVEEPSRKSFGTLTIGALGQQLNGLVHPAYKPAGFVYIFDVPLNSLTVKPPA